MPVQLEHLVGDRAAGVKEAEAGLVSFAGTKERRLNRNLRAEATLPAAALRFIRKNTGDVAARQAGTAAISGLFDPIVDGADLTPARAALE